MEKERLVQVFDKQADMWERRRKQRSVDTKWRQQLLKSAKGEILEVAVGAGGNFQFYKSAAKVTALDFSPMMINKAKHAAQEHRIEAEFHVGDIENVDLPAKSFDTVVSTLSLCAYSNPLHVLRQMNHWCKDDGYVLLCEHGKSSFAPLNWALNIINPIQIRTAGCHLNRDIIGLLSRSPLRIERMESHFLGMVHLIWARPN